MKLNLKLNLLTSVLLFPSFIVSADNVSVFLSGSEIAGSNAPTSFNVAGDTVAVNSESFEAVIYKGKDNKGESAVLKQGDKTPFNFSSILIRPASKGQSEYPLIFEVGNKFNCVNLAVELRDSEGKFINLYSEADVTFTLNNQPDDRQFKRLCASDGKIDIAQMAIDKLGSDFVEGGKVLLTAYNSGVPTGPYSAFNFFLNGTLANGDGQGASFDLDKQFGFMSNYPTWQSVLERLAPNHVKTIL